MTSFKAGELVWCCNYSRYHRRFQGRTLGVLIKKNHPNPTYSLWRVLVGSETILFDSGDMEKVNG